MERLEVNISAPDFELADYKGRPVRLSSYAGSHVLLVFNRGFM